MKLGESYLTDRARLAAHEEIRNSESMMLADLSEIVTAENISEGFCLDFGNDKASLSVVIDTLGIEEAVNGEQPTAHIHNVMAVHTGHTVYLGKSIKGLRELPLADAIDVLQAEMWKEYKLFNIYDGLEVPDDDIYSRIIIGQPDERDPSRTDLSKLGVAVGARVRYIPDLADPDGFGQSLAGLFAELKEEVGNSRMDNLVGRLATELNIRGDELLMPKTDYYLVVGKLELTNYLMPTVSGVIAGYDNFFQLENGRFIRVNDSELEG